MNLYRIKCLAAIAFKDECRLLDILENEMEGNDLIAKVKRLSDGEKFEIGF